MNRMWCVLPLALAFRAPLALASESMLSSPTPHQGHFIALGLRYGGIRAKDTGKEGWRPLSHGASPSLRLGQAITEWLDLGLSLGLGFTTGGDSLFLGHITAHAQWYVTSFWFVHTGVGMGASGGPDPDDEEFDRGRYGDVYVLGVGRNIYLTEANQSGGFVLAPIAHFEVGPDREFSTFALWLGVELSWWSGLSRDKLKLPLEDAYGSSHQSDR